MGTLFVIALLALFAGVGIVALIETEPGYLLIAYGGYTVETSFWVGIVLIALVVLSLYTLLRFLHRVMTSPRGMLNWAGARRLRQSARLTTRGVISFTEGNWTRSRKQLLRGARYSESPLTNYLLAARASQRLRESDATDRYLTQAAESDPDARTAVVLTQAELQIQAKQYDRAVETLEQAQDGAGKHPYVLHLLYRAHDGRGDLDAMAALVPELRRNRVAGPIELDDLEERVYDGLLERASARGVADELKTLWKRFPARLKDTDEVQLKYLEALLACDEGPAVEKDIVRRLKKEWQPPLVDLYGRVPRSSAAKPLAIAQGWLKRHPDDPVLLLCLGRLAMVEREWSKAREYLERSHAQMPREEVCLELGRLLTSVGEHAAAAAVYRVGSQLRARPLPDLPQPDDVVPEAMRLEDSDA